MTATIGNSIDSYRRQIEAALAYSGGSHTYEDVAAGVASGEFQAWYGPSSIMVTEVRATPREKAVNVFLAGGSQKELELMEPFVCEWGRKRGCSSIYMTGRRGWLRSFLSRKGWQDRKLVVMHKPLSGHTES